MRTYDANIHPCEIHETHNPKPLVTMLADGTHVCPTGYFNIEEAVTYMRGGSEALARRVGPRTWEIAQARISAAEKSRTG